GDAFGRVGPGRTRGRGAPRAGISRPSVRPPGCGRGRGAAASSSGWTPLTALGGQLLLGTDCGWIPPRRRTVSPAPPIATRPSAAPAPIMASPHANPSSEDWIVWVPAGTNGTAVEPSRRRVRFPSDRDGAPAAGPPLSWPVLEVPGSV